MLDRTAITYKYCVINNYLDKGPKEVEMTLAELVRRLTTFQTKNWSNAFDKPLTYEDYHFWRAEKKRFAKLSKEANEAGDKDKRKEYSEESKKWMTYEQDVKNGKAFLPYTYKDYGKKNAAGKLDARRKDNVASGTLVVLDLDSGVTYADVLELLGEYEFVMMSSISETPALNRFRVVLFPNEPLTVEQQVELVKRIDVRLPEKNPIDAKTFAIDPVGLKDEQLYFSPAWIQGNPCRPTAVHNEGRLITADDLPLTEELQARLDARAESSRSHSKAKTEEMQAKLKAMPAASNPAIHYMMVDGVSTPFLHPQAALETEEGWIALKDIVDEVSMVTCPNHYDANGTEYAWRNNKSGKIWLRCKHCGDIKEREPEAKLWDKKVVLPKKKKVKPTQPLIEYFPEERFKLPETNDEKFKKLSAIAKTLKGTNVLFAPEGYGKSFMIIALLKMGYKILFCSQTNSQAGEKACVDFVEWVKDPMHGLNISKDEIFHWFSKEWYFKEQTDGEVELATKQVFTPWDRGEVDREGTIKNLIVWIAQNNLCPPGHDMVEFADALFKECYEDIHVPPFAQLVEEKKIIATTMARLSVVCGASGMYKWMDSKWVIFLDDPGLSDLQRLYKVSDGMLKARQDEEMRRSIKGLKPLEPIEELLVTRLNTEKKQTVRYWVRPTDKVPGLPLLQKYNHRMNEDQYSPKKTLAKVVHTTTEALTWDLIQHRFKIEDGCNHDIMDNVIGGTITLIGTWMVRSKYDNIFPAMVNRLKQLGTSEREITLIGDAIGSEVNLVNNKGVNTLKKSDTIIEISKPHTERVLSLNDELCWAAAGEPSGTFTVMPDSDSMKISGILAYDQLNQALGRNSGHRAIGAEAIALVDPDFFSNFQSITRYKFADWSFMVSEDTNKSRLRKKEAPWVEHGASSSVLVKQLVEWLKNPMDFVDNHLMDAIQGLSELQIQGAHNAALYLKDKYDGVTDADKESLGGRRLHPALTTSA